MFAILFHFGREIIKDAADVNGDRRAGLRTSVTVWGIKRAVRLASTVFSVLAVVLVIPFALGYFGMVYLMIISFGVWPALAYAVISPLKDSSEENLRRVSSVLKIAMPIGVIAVLAGFQG